MPGIEDFLIPTLLSGLGGIFGSKERQTIDPAVLERLFGPGAISKEAQQLFRLLAASPQFTQIMNQAALSGQGAANRLQSGLASRGLSGTPIGAFQSAASRGFGGAMQRQAQGGLFAQALQAALQNVGNRQNIFAQSQLQRQGQPTFGRLIGSGLLAAGGQGFSGLLDSVGGGGGGGGGTSQDPFNLLQRLGR